MTYHFLSSPRSVLALAPLMLRQLRNQLRKRVEVPSQFLHLPLARRGDLILKGVQCQPGKGD
eukprot:5080762-Prorocentrum_lima.AAC.1